LSVWFSVIIFFGWGGVAVFPLIEDRMPYIILHSVSDPSFCCHAEACATEARLITDYHDLGSLHDFLQATKVRYEIPYLPTHPLFANFMLEYTLACFGPKSHSLSLVRFQGPKQARAAGQLHSNTPRYGYSRLDSIPNRAI